MKKYSKYILITKVTYFINEKEIIMIKNARKKIHFNHLYEKFVITKF